MQTLTLNHWERVKAIRLNKAKTTIDKIENIVSDDLSQFGFCWGYCGSISALTLVMILSFIFIETTKASFYFTHIAKKLRIQCESSVFGTLAWK